MTTKRIPTTRVANKTEPLLRVCSYEDRPEGMDGLILMAESLCRVDPHIALHLSVPQAPASVQAWARRWPQVMLATQPPEGVSGWDVKPWLLLQELHAGSSEVLWLDADMIVTHPISRLLQEFPAGSLIVAEEWDNPGAICVTDFWGLPSLRSVRPINSCFLRVTQAHQALLERWLHLMHDPRYREAQALPFEQRPWHLASDQVLLSALLGSEDFGQTPLAYLRMGRHIAQCAGSSGYRPLHRLLDLFRGLPPLIHCIGRKPWMSQPECNRIHRFLLNLAADVSPYVLASRRVAKDLDATPDWAGPRTALGALLCGLTASHPGMAGLPLAILHTCYLQLGRTIRFGQKKHRHEVHGANQFPCFYQPSRKGMASRDPTQA